MKTGVRSQGSAVSSQPEVVGGHTPGPWCFIQTTSEYKTLKIIKLGEENDRPSIAYTIDTEANARLIAAAPEMLEALEKARKYIDHVSHDSHGLVFDFADFDLLEEVELLIEKATNGGVR